MTQSPTIQNTFYGFYTVFMVFALENAAQSFIKCWNENVHGPNHLLLIQVILALLAFLSTILPFYHGTCRHWALSYTTDTLRSNRPLLHVDFYFAVIHGLIFLFMGIHLAEPIKLVSWFHVLLIWNIIALLILFTCLRRTRPEIRICGIKGYLRKILNADPNDNLDSQVFSIERLNAWIVINLGCLMVLLILDYFVLGTLCIWNCKPTAIDSGFHSNPARVFWVFVAVAFVRSALDHALSEYGRVTTSPLALVPLTTPNPVPTQSEGHPQRS